jgi:predicted nucleotidyltransferase component of viral defense system
MEMMPLAELRIISGEKGFNFPILEKDYLVTYLLYLLRDVKHIYFKGGTALNKIFLNHARLSEDLDYTVTGEIKKVEKEIKETLKGTIFVKITHDKRVDKFTRLIVHYKLYGDDGTIFIDLNQRGKLILASEKHKVPHFYGEYIPQFSIHTLNRKELMAEKMAATIGRNRPRDHLDVYNIIKKGFLLDLSIVKKKCKTSGDEFNILKMFNRAKKLKNRWNEEVEQFLTETVSFQKVMKSLAKHFKLKEEKEKLKKT